MKMIKKELKSKQDNKYRNLSEEKKNIKREYGRNRYHDISEENQKNYRKTKKSQYNNE